MVFKFRVYNVEILAQTTLSGAYTLHKTRSLSIINKGKVTQQAMALVILGLHNIVMSDVCPTVIATVTLWTVYPATNLYFKFINYFILDLIFMWIALKVNILIFYCLYRSCSS